MSKIIFFKNDIHHFSELLIIDVDGEGTPGAFNNNCTQLYKHSHKIIAFGGLPTNKKINEIVKNPRISAICYGNPLCYQEHAISEIRSKVYPNLLRNHKLL